MESQERRRFDVVDCTVVGHVHYGLLVESEDGERGYVDKAHITDKPGEPWPVAGQQLRCVVLGYATGNRLRAAATPSYVEAITAADDPAEAVRAWSRQRADRHDATGA